MENWKGTKQNKTKPMYPLEQSLLQMKDTMT